MAPSAAINLADVHKHRATGVGQVSAEVGAGSVGEVEVAAAGVEAAAEVVAGAEAGAGDGEEEAEAGDDLMPNSSRKP